MSKKNLQKHIKYKLQGDKLEVIIRDAAFTKVYNREVSIRNKKELSGLIQDLRDKGVDLLSALKSKPHKDTWFD